ncbi:MAG: hypothetical protein COT74_10230 [Bdellovibrionales bacterium CG10_big_fil_rev_8_21_14_0_10_45_34]|nr:MAG: hypothetical protein COT74_10230 [Bdellovibrionales bacterium CG10_big_fil_rev_8_21_14_0_10_45_34]
MKFCRFFLITTLLFTLCGCSSFGRKMKSFFSGDTEDVNSQTYKPNAKPGTLYSENNYLPVDDEIVEYRRMTKDRFESEANLDGNSSSLWVMDGQSSYLFAPNSVRLLGDPISVELDGEPKKQIEAKAQVIASLLKERELASLKEAGGEEADPKLAESGAKKDDKGAAPAAQAANKKPQEDFKFDVSAIPGKIVEQLDNGSYRIKGYQNLMIGKNEFRVIMAGTVHSKDINDTKVLATKMIEPRFDIVSLSKDFK